MKTALHLASEAVASMPGSFTCQLCDYGQVTQSPWASDSSSVNASLLTYKGCCKLLSSLQTQAIAIMVIKSKWHMNISQAWTAADYLQSYSNLIGFYKYIRLIMIFLIISFQILSSNSLSLPCHFSLISPLSHSYLLLNSAWHSGDS